ncbi:hypothetical protein BJ165DRAFT_1072017 [Panaeolus papilionaceus]|nr:hypothetical protein BJ165DRAFT_1072017 [Panaeolus papilionaceus]
MRIVPTFNTQRVIVSVVHGLASITTVFRLLHRSRARRLWWDDFWALCATVCSLVTVLVFLLPVRRLPEVDRDNNFAVPVHASIMVVLLVFYVAGLWFARISIAVTIVRLLSDGVFRAAAKTATCFFGLSGALLIVMRIVNCGTKLDKPPLCRMPRYVAYTELLLDIMADLWLIVAPLVLLFRTSLSHKHRRLIAGIFGCGLLITSTSVLHVTYLMSREYLMSALTAHIQLSVAVLVCNLLVLVAYVHQKYHSRGLGPSRIPNTATIAHPTREASRPTTGLHPSCPCPPESDHQTPISHVSLTELGSSMLGGSSRDMTSFGVCTLTSSAPRASDEFRHFATT